VKARTRKTATPATTTPDDPQRQALRAELDAIAARSEPEGITDAPAEYLDGLRRRDEILSLLGRDDIADNGPKPDGLTVTLFWPAGEDDKARATVTG
jgi:hypothetical protein